MANEKRLLSVDNAISHYKALANIEWNKKVSPVSWADAYEEFIEYLEEAPTVDAVEVNKYEALVGMYHDLRENFIDYVCSGIRNEAPYCLNKCKACVDKRGWCKLEKCKGFNPAEVILDRYAKMDGGNEDG